MKKPNQQASSIGHSTKLAYSISELTQVVPVCRTGIYEEIKAGRLHPTKIGRRTMILAAEVDRWLAERAAATRGAAE